jgi:hypothetical protein
LLSNQDSGLLSNHLKFKVIPLLLSNQLYIISAEGDDVHNQRRSTVSMFEAIPDHELLDNSPSKARAQLAKDGGLAGRRPPTKKVCLKRKDDVTPKVGMRLSALADP